jgi:peptide/nickel transport system permease protein
VRFLLRRIAFYVAAFWTALTIDFFLPRMLPGDPAAIILGSANQMSPEQIAGVRAAMGLTDAPMLEQYVTYLGHALRGDFGTSFSYFPASVTSVISTSLIWTLLLGTVALAIAYGLGMLLGILASWRRGGILDTVFPPTLIFVGAFPPFFLALGALYLFGLTLGWFPTAHAYDTTLTPSLSPEFVGSVAHHLVTPALVIVLVSIGGWALGMRNVMVGVLAEDYVTLAEAKGLSQRRIMLRYAARNAMLPSVTGFGLALGFILSGQILIETVFSYPGVGNQLVAAVVGRDYPLMQGLFMLITTAVLLANFAVDVLYTRLDPRVRGG